jgi:signal transduction histidine kinase
MKPRLRILHLEDDPNDAALAQAALEAAGIACDHTRVETRADFSAALELGGMDVILSDFSLPAFDGLSALEMAKARRPDIPFILVSGILGEERAIDALKCGATDYVLKHRLTRLVPAVQRALQEFQERGKRLRAEVQSREYSRKLQALSRRLVETQETERRNIARELHDEIGQALTVIQLNLKSELRIPGTGASRSRLQETLEVVEQLLQRVRDLALDLRPSILDHLGLTPALQWLTNRQVTAAGLKGEFRGAALKHRLDSVIETECFRVAQEALTNVARHADAKNVTVELHAERGQLHLRIRDDGIGFNVTAMREQALHGASLGLLSMEERAALAGGALEFKSLPGHGTEVHARFPMKGRHPRT